MSDERKLTKDERWLLKHVVLWGSEGYPVKRLGRGWVWGTDGVPGPPVVFKTKQEAVANFQAFLEVLDRAEYAERYPDRLAAYDAARATGGDA